MTGSFVGAVDNVPVDQRTVDGESQRENTNRGYASQQDTLS
jgi:hypothetical protein